MTEEYLQSEYPVILVSKKEKERLRRPWRRSLIIKLLGRTVGYNFLLQRLQRMWRTDAAFDLISLDQDFFLVRFENLKDYESVKFGGPYLVLGHYLISQEWVPNFVPKNNKVRKMLVWIRFPAFPNEFLKRIGMQIGRPIRVDTTTSLASKGKFARVCVEVDITKPLVSKFVLDFQEWPIEYEGFHMVCFDCGLYGHRQDQCGKENPITEICQTTGEKEMTIENRPNAIKQGPPGKYGAWMLVTRKDRRN
ncbi:PREDICTED: uncharacterized protein LOC109151955 [Ipomoea nil]|uniref:uncharacterized protein LOC109151955 n=1 Tax=Ipomoea nil TaxID=35883 RepID=UPI000900BE2D|nr:PREDICTED: uncharacterized protein LOC109151955 [Ipomoea nil]